MSLLPLTALEFGFDSFADELGALVGAGDGINTIDSFASKADQHGLGNRIFVERRASHARRANRYHILCQSMLLADISY